MPFLRDLFGMCVNFVVRAPSNASLLLKFTCFYFDAAHWCYTVLCFDCCVKLPELSNDSGLSTFLVSFERQMHLEV